MQKMGWQQAQGPAAAVVLTLEGTDGTKIKGSQSKGLAHEHTSMKPHNMSRWVDMGMEVIKQGGEVVKDSLVIRGMMMVGGTGMSARLVVIPQRVGSAALYLDIASMKLRDLREICKNKNVALADPNITTCCGYIWWDKKGGR